MEGERTAEISIDENSINSVATVSATDPDGDTVSYSLTGGADQNLFSVEASSGVLSFKVAPDFENPDDSDNDNKYVIQITATDDSSDTLTDSQTLTISVSDINEPPSFTTTSISAVEGDIQVATILGTDPDNDTLEFSLTGGSDKALFTLDQNTGVLAFDVAPDFESPLDADKDNTYDVEITLTDDGEGKLTTAKLFGITVTDKQEAPIITSNGGGDTASVDIAENTTDVTTFIADDPDSDNLVFTLTGGPDKDLFDINAGFGVLSFKVAPDFETPADSDGDNKYVVEVTVTDDGADNLTDVQTLTVNLTNANEAPVITSNDGGPTAAIGLEEGTQEITTVTATDPDGDALAYSISGGVDSDQFSISSIGALSFKNAPDFADPKDTGKDNSYIVEVSVTDDGVGALSVSQTITVTIANVLEVPVISSNGGGDTADIAVDENVSSAITTVTATDPDGSGLEFKITGGADSGLFALNKDTGKLTFSKPPDHEIPADLDADNVYEVIVSAIGKVKADLVSASFDSDSQGFTHQKDPLGNQSSRSFSRELRSRRRIFGRCVESSHWSWRRR